MKALFTSLSNCFTGVLFCFAFLQKIIQPAGMAFQIMTFYCTDILADKVVWKICIAWLAPNYAHRWIV